MCEGFDSPLATMDKRAKRRKSTNPFDSSSDEESVPNDVYHDCHEAPGKKRAAHLDFNFKFDEVGEQPALRFDTVGNSQPTNDFFSPLEAALLDELGNGDTDDEEESGEETDDVPTEEESTWVSLMKKAKGTLMMGLSPATAKDELKESEHGVHSRRDSQSSFQSARSIESVSIISRRSAETTPTHSRQGSFRGELRTSHPGERGSLIRRSSIKKKRRRSSLATSAVSIKPVANPVLEKLETFERESDFDSPWTKMILLEELGTASSWTILLLPYFAFIISVLLDTRSAFTVASVGPLNATSSCVKAPSPMTSYGVPLSPASSKACSYPYALETGSGILANGKNTFLLQTFHYKDLMRKGEAFTSGPILNVSPMSTFLTGDVFFHGLSLETVSVVANGMVMVSAIVMQQLSDHAADWAPVFVSRPDRLSLACIPDVTNYEKPTTKTNWNCTSPRIVDVVFAMPGTGILNGGELQAYLLYSSYDLSNASAQEFFHGMAPYKDAKGTESFVFDESGSGMIRPNDKVSDSLLSQMVASSSYTFEHDSMTYSKVKITVRLLTLIVTFIFTLLWCWSLGIRGFFKGCSRFCGCCCSHRRSGYDEDTTPLSGRRRKTNWMWWESPWIVFPERRYLFLLLIFLMMIQNPLLTYAYFKPHLYGSATVRTISDIMVGVGVQGMLMMWLFVVQGVRYHTASFAFRRAKHQRQLLELRRAAKFVADSGHGNYGTDEVNLSAYMDEFFERFGDVDGIRSVGDLAIRLKSDPCGDSWADFLLPKLLLFSIGVAAVVITAVVRFPTSTNSNVVLDPSRLHTLNVLYVGSSIVQMLVLIYWIYLILRNTFLTGAKLRKEPFLNTRPAQLAYRVLLGMLLLGVGSLVVPLVVDLVKTIRKWSPGKTSRAIQGAQTMDRSPIVDIFLKILWKASQKFPFSGTAASIGPGKLVFATTIGLVSAFIFLPSKPYYEGDRDTVKNGDSRHVVGDEKLFSLALTERMNQRRDKRRVVRLARHTHTWRIFPLPIRKVSVRSKILSETSFQLNKNERSAVYISRYVPVFCLEIACWLLEASWQAYYSPENFSLDDWAPGRMALESIGLQLEHSIVDESLHTQAYVASNISPQVDGEEGSIIVVAFRGTANSRNMKTDLTFRQTPLFEQITGSTDDQITFEVHPDRIDAFDTDGRFFDTPMKREADGKVLSFSPIKKMKQQDSTTFNWHDESQSTLAAVTTGAKSVIKAVPVARQALPCVHEGFLQAYAHIRQEVLEGVMDVLQRQFRQAVFRAKMEADSDIAANVGLVLPKIYITGHSLGGSLAQLLALDIASNCELVVNVEPFMNQEPSGAEDFFLLPSPTESSPETHSKGRVRLFSFDDSQSSDTRLRPKTRTMRLQPPIAVYSYGQPRLGNRAFSRIYKQRVPHTFRVACEGDAFTTMPPTVLCGWSGLYKHAGLEVLLDEGCTGNILVGPTVVETLFRFTKVRTSVAAHSMERYRDGLESALGQDELEEYYRGHGNLMETRGSADGLFMSTVPDWVIKRPELDPS